MKWLLVFVWTINGDVHVTTERFETMAECATTAVVLNEWDFALHGSEKTWRCSKLEIR